MEITRWARSKPYSNTHPFNIESKLFQANILETHFGFRIVILKSNVSSQGPGLLGFQNFFAVHFDADFRPMRLDSDAVPFAGRARHDFRGSDDIVERTDIMISRLAISPIENLHFKPSECRIFFRAGTK